MIDEQLLGNDLIALVLFGDKDAILFLKYFSKLALVKGRVTFFRCRINNVEREFSYFRFLIIVWIFKWRKEIQDVLKCLKSHANREIVETSNFICPKNVRFWAD